MHIRGPTSLFADRYDSSPENALEIAEIDNLGNGDEGKARKAIREAFHGDDAKGLSEHQRINIRRVYRERDNWVDESENARRKVKRKRRREKKNAIGESHFFWEKTIGCISFYVIRFLLVTSNLSLIVSHDYNCM